MKLKTTLVTLSLLILISTSSFFWLNSLVTAVENGHASRSQLAHISQFGLKARLYSRLEVLTVGGRKWQAIAKALAKTDGKIAFNLGKYYLENQSIRQAILWFSQAIRLKHQVARVLLAKTYISNNKLNEAKALLLPIINDANALPLFMDIAITEGESAIINKYANQLKAQTSNTAFYQTLLNYKIIQTNQHVSLPSCLATVQPYATNLENLANFEKLISSKKLAPLRPYICFSEVKYISKKRLACQHEKSSAIFCNENLWQSSLLTVTENAEGAHFLAVLVEKGGANVNAGILYLDSEDTDEVFFHELTHLLGFVDEYRLAENHQRCLSVQEQMFAHNIAVLPRFYHGDKQKVRAEILAQLPWAKYIKPSTKIMTKTAQGWLLGTNMPEPRSETVGAYFSETCSESNFIAVKPLKQRTALRYFEEKFPDLYLKLLEDEPERFLMPSFEYNKAKKVNKVE
jgi:hypothetical protein